jgi:hypothetical protein
MMNSKTLLAIVLLAPFVLTACTNATSENTSSSNVTSAAEEISAEKNTSSVVASAENTITTAGTYTFTGKIDGTILVNASKDDDVEIIFDNVEISSSTNAPVYVQEAKNVTITLAENSTNTIIDNRTSEEDTEDFPNAAIYSMSDLKIKGEKKSLLVVTGNLNDGITSKDDLKIKDANIQITAKDDGVRGKDSLEISESTLVVTAQGDALKSDNSEDEEKGIITIEESDITISAGDDAIGAVQLVEILSGNIDIQKSYEGLEGKKITIHDGIISIVSSDDALNVAEKSTSTDAGFGGRGGMNAVLEEGMLSIFGGTITISAQGDGFDSNGNAVMTGGTLIVNGPTNSGNGPIDVNGTFLVSGGTIIAVGSSGMAETPDAQSQQLSIQVNFDSMQSAGAVIALQDENGNEVFSFTPAKQFQSVTYSSDKLELGKTYTFLADGQEYTTLALEDTVTKYGEGERMGGGMRGGDFDNGVMPTDMEQMGEREMRTPPNMTLPDNWDDMTEDEKRAYMEANRPARPDEVAQ